MSYQPYYYITDWQNWPSQKTAVNRTHLLKIENGIKEADNRIVQIDANKADQSTVNTMVKDVTLDTNTGILAVTLQNGAVRTYDLDIEKVVTNFDINDQNELVLTLADGTEKVIDLTRFVYSVESTATISMVITDRAMRASIVDGSVTMEKLDAAIQTEFRQYMLDAQAARDAALQYQKNAKRYTEGDEEFPESETDNAKYYYEQVKLNAATSGQNAQAAANSEQIATEQANIARQKAANASASETNAAGSAQIATQKAAAAATSEQSAKDKADLVEAAATTAAQKASEASTSEANAKTYMQGSGNKASQAQAEANRAKSEADRAASYVEQVNPGALTGIEATDTTGVLGVAGATVRAQALVDGIVNSVITNEEIDEIDSQEGAI